MAPIVDTTHRGRHVRIVSADSTADEPIFSVLIDGRVFPGYRSRVDALAAARRILAAVA